MIFISFRITIRSLKGDLLTFKGVKSYEIEEGIIVFANSVDGSIKRFSTSNAEIEEEKIDGFYHKRRMIPDEI